MEFLNKSIPKILLAGLLVGNVLIWHAVFERGNHNFLTVFFLNVGQGDGIYIETPNGNNMMIDAGPDARVLEELSKVMAFNRKDIGLILVSNPDKDHYGGFLDVLNYFDVGTVIEPGTVSVTATYAEFERLVRKKGIEDLLAWRGMHVLLDKDVDLEIFFPERDVSNFKINDGSIIAKLTYGNTCFILGGDATKLDELFMVSKDRQKLDCQVLKVNHHGSKSSTSEDYVASISPEIAIISLGKDNRYGHPHKETLNTLAKYEVPVYRTDLNGMVTVRSDGSNIFVETEK